jgi:hypothetical protein
MKQPSYFQKIRTVIVLFVLLFQFFSLKKSHAQGQPEPMKLQVDIPLGLKNKEIGYFNLGLKLPVNLAPNAILGTIDWGDNKPNTQIIYIPWLPNQRVFSHTYDNAGVYNIEISFPQMSLFMVTQKAASTYKQLIQWGDVPNLEYASFYNAIHLNNVPATLPQSITTCYKMFTNCKELNDNDIANWNVIQVRHFAYMFAGCDNFNVNISQWQFNNHLRRVAMVGFLNSANVFNQNISDWCFQFSKPAFFDTGTPIENVEQNLPKWNGNCPPQNVPPQSLDNMELEVNIPMGKVNESISFFKALLNLPINAQPNEVIGYVDWGDGQVSSIVFGQFPNPNSFSHTYQNPNLYVIKISYPNIKEFELDPKAAGLLLRIKQWGRNMPNLQKATFRGALNLVDVPANLPQTIIDCNRMFFNCTNLNDNDIALWHVDNVLNFTDMFNNCSAFNVNISNWQFNANLVQTALTRFLRGAAVFQQDLSNWCFPFPKSNGFSTACPIDNQLVKQPVWNGNCCPPPVVVNVVPGFFDVEISWNNVNQLLASTDVEIRINDGLFWRKANTLLQDHTFDNLVPNANYKYRIRTRCNNPGTLSNYVEGEFNTLNNNNILPPCQVPNAVFATVNAPSSFTISWEPVQNAASYFVQYKRSDKLNWDLPSNLIGGASVSNITYKTFNYLTPGATYDYRIRTTCNTIPPPGQNNLTPFSSEGTVTLPNGIGMPIFFDAKSDDWTFYPNPTADIVNVEFNLEGDEEVNLLVLDMTGRIIQQIKSKGLMGNNQIQISLGQLPSGIYVLKAVYGLQCKLVGRVSKQ